MGIMNINPSPFINHICTEYGSKLAEYKSSYTNDDPTIICFYYN